MPELEYLDIDCIDKTKTDVASIWELVEKEIGARKNNIPLKIVYCFVASTNATKGNAF